MRWFIDTSTLILGLLMVTMKAESRILTVYFGDQNKMPYELESSPQYNLTFLDSVFGRLVRVDSNFGLQPEHLKRFSFDSSLDGYVLELDPTLKFHNGRQVTSADLEFSLLRGFFTPKPNYFKVFIGNIEGVDAIKSGESFSSGKVKGVKVLDDKRILVKLISPNPSFLHSIGNSLFSLVPREELKEDYFTWKKAPIGAGKFRVSGLDVNKGEIALEPIDKIKSGVTNVRLLYKKTDAQVDISFKEASGFQRTNFVRPFTVSALFFSNSNKLGEDANFRKLIANAIRRQSLISATSEEAYQILPKIFWGRLPEGLAQKRQSKIETKEIPAGTKVKTSILSLEKDPAPQKKKIKEMLEETWKSLKLSATVGYTANKFLSPEEGRENAFFAFSILANYYDPLIMFSGIGPGSPLKVVSREQDAKFMALYNKAKQAKDYQERIRTIQELSTYLIEESYVIPLTYEFVEVFWDSKKVKNLGPLDTPALLQVDKIEMVP